MGKLKDFVFNEVRSDYVINRKDSFLYKFLLEGKMKDKCCGLDQNKQEKVIHKAATDLMYNLGYPLSAEKNVEKLKSELADYDNVKQKARERMAAASINEAARINKKVIEKEQSLNERLAEAEAERIKDKGREKRHNNTALDLADMWYTQYGIRNHEGNHASIEECQELYDILKRQAAYKNVIVPVRIDSDAGTGVYIIGSEYKIPSKMKNKMHCNIVILTPCIEESTFSIRVDDEGYEDMETAFDFFENTVHKNGMEFISFGNGKSPDGIPKVFKKYFEDDEEDKFNTEMNRIDILTKEDIEETMKIFADEE
jgi:hypothetical protein